MDICRESPVSAFRKKITPNVHRCYGTCPQRYALFIDNFPNENEASGLPILFQKNVGAMHENIIILCEVSL